MSIRIGRRGRCGRKEPEKIFRRKEENENISFNPTTVGGGVKSTPPSGLSFSITFERLFV